MSASLELAEDGEEPWDRAIDMAHHSVNWTEVSKQVWHHALPYLAVYYDVRSMQQRYAEAGTIRHTKGGQCVSRCCSRRSCSSGSRTAGDSHRSHSPIVEQPPMCSGCSKSTTHRRTALVVTISYSDSVYLEIPRTRLSRGPPRWDTAPPHYYFSFADVFQFLRTIRKSICC